MCNRRVTGVRIGPFTYKVQAVKDLRNDDDRRMYGVISYADCAISIDDSSDPQVAEVTLWHEIIHAILTHANIHNHKEKVIDVIAHGIVQVLKDNPSLIGCECADLALSDEAIEEATRAADGFIKKHPDIAVVK